VGPVLTQPDGGSSELQHWLMVAVDAAKAAGALLLSLGESGRRTVIAEEGRDLKLSADRQSEAVIVSSLQAATPFPILSEESGTLEHQDGDGRRRWVVDPLDGTVNYSRGIDFCCVSVALLDGSEPVLGVVHDFGRGETFVGVVGGGAWLNDRPIHVSDVTRLDRAVLCAGFPVGGDFSTAGIMRFARQMQQYKKVRLLGSAALSLAHLAAGRVDAYVEHGIRLWDVAAGIAIVRAAGGRASAAVAAHDWSTLTTVSAANATLPLADA